MCSVTIELKPNIDYHKHVECKLYRCDLVEINFR